MSRQIIKAGNTRGMWIGANEAKALAITIDFGARVAGRGSPRSSEIRMTNLHCMMAELLRHLGDNGGGIISVDPRDA